MSSHGRSVDMILIRLIIVALMLKVLASLDIEGEKVNEGCKKTKAVVRKRT